MSSAHAGGLISRDAMKETHVSKPALSKVGLDRMHEVLAGHVEHSDVPGIVTLVSRRGEVHVDAHRHDGRRAVEGGRCSATRSSASRR